MNKLGNVKIDVVILAAGSNGLGAVRSLHKESLSIAVICPKETDESMRSSLPQIKYWITAGKDAASKEDQLFSFLEKFESMQPVIIPTADWQVTALIEREEYVKKHFKTCLPDAKILHALIDKAEEVNFVVGAVELPKTLVTMPASVEEFMSALSLPAIVKPRSHKHYVLRAKNIRLYSREDVEKFYARFAEVLSSVIAQEMIEGPDEAQWVCNCFFDSDSELVDAFTFNRLNLSPAHFGVTSYAISEYNSDVIEFSRKLGQQIGYVAPAMVEFKRDVRDNVYRYIELNPRLGMCNYFDTCCGVNNVYYSYLLASGKALPKPTREMKSGVIYFDVWDDFYSRKKDGTPILSILKIYLKDIFKTHVFSHFVWHDPKPSFYRWKFVVKSVLGLK